MCDPRFKLAIFEHLWKDNSSYIIKRTKIHFKETYRKYQERATRQRNIEVLDTEPQDNLELDDEDDLFAGCHGRPNRDLATPESDNRFSQGTIDYNLITSEEMSRCFG